MTTPRSLSRAAVLLVLAAFPLWLPVFPPSIGESLRGRVFGWAEPILQGITAVRRDLGDGLSGILELFSLREENRILRAQAEALRAHEGTHQELSEENARLRALLDFKAKVPWKILPAEVIGRELGPWSRSLLVGKGSRDGVHPGLAVVTPTGLVGRVGQVGPSWSRVVLLADPHFRVAASLAGRKAAGLVIGGGGGEISFTYLPLDLELKAGEAVLTSGGQSFAPDGIPIGRIQWVSRDSSLMYQMARLKPSVAPGGVQEVGVVLWRPSDSAQSF